MRLFVGIKVPASALPAVEKASAPLVDALGVKMVEKENLHLTLKFIGDTDEETAKKIEDALSAIKFSPFSVSLSGSGAFPDRHFPRAIWIGGKSEGAEKLAVEVEKALSFLNLKKERFTVHLTVARAPKSVGDIEDFLASVTGEVCGFEATSFLLIKSKLTPVGPVYEVIKEYKAQ
ncbi:RNA 2',3'-cyclic phosphodiesterase [uncultured archaeon]|nr:RNA 2',3'-cyclic phosphodiesterase [uncultured archaeon]